MAHSGAEFPQPIFVGGSPRSGTHAMGRLVAAHPRYHLIRVEARFHAAGGGLTDLLEGRTDLARFLEVCRRKWWKRGIRGTRGLQLVADEEQVDAALARFEEGFSSDPWGACRTLVDAILGEAARRDGKPAFVDVSGPNIQSAPTLHRLFPRARFINMVRDGRAVVAGIVNKTDMTDDPMQALDQWEKRVRLADEALRRLPDGAALVMPLDELAALDRESRYRELVDFLELDDDGAVREHFEGKISPEAAHVGGWRERMPPPEVRLVDRRYRRLMRELRRAGVSWLPPLRDAGVGIGPVRLRGRARG
jgi:Sulfotransferase family